jgi:hypothetical protein
MRPFGCVWTALLAASLAACVPAGYVPAYADPAEPQASPEWVFTGDRWALSLYSGLVTDGNIFQALALASGFEPAGFIDLKVSNELLAHRLSPSQPERVLSFDLDVGVGRHVGEQDHVEFTAALVARWHPFIWDDVVETSIAIAQGVSYTTSIPNIEARRWYNTAQLLNHMFYEATFSLSEVPEWGLIARLHHRSGVWGLYSGVSGASNVALFGVRYRF